MFSVWCHFLIGLIELFVSYLSCKQVDPSGGYENLVTVRSFMPHYHLAGGVNLPKIIDCVGSDGKSRRQLVKVSVCACLTCAFDVRVFFVFQQISSRVPL